MVFLALQDMNAIFARHLLGLNASFEALSALEDCRDSEDSESNFSTNLPSNLIILSPYGSQRRCAAFL